MSSSSSSLSLLLSRASELIALPFQHVLIHLLLGHVDCTLPALLCCHTFLNGTTEMSVNPREKHGTA